MTDLTPEKIVEYANLVVKRLEGYQADVQDVMEGLGEDGTLPFGYHDAPSVVFAKIDEKVWRCDDCDYWCPTAELKNGLCYGCRPAPR